VLDETALLEAYTRPGAYADPDMLEVGNGALTESEQRAHFSLWSILSAPLLAGTDLTSMTEATRQILTNQELIAIDQDPLGLQGALVRRDGDLDIFAKPLASCGARGVVLFNRGEVPIDTTLNWSELWLLPGPASVRDLWSHSELSADAEQVSLTVPPHDVAALLVTGREPPSFRGEVALGSAPFTYATNGYGPVERNMSNGELELGDGHPLSMRGRVYQDGLGAHAPSLIRFRLGGQCSRFTAEVGVDDEEVGLGSVVFQVWSDGVKLFDSGQMTGTTPPRQVDVNLENRMDLRLFVGIAEDDDHHDHADWAEARLTCATEPIAR
jgi:alpha-galactosidase